MSEIEELTDEERLNLTHGIAASLGQAKALRIIDAQSATIERQAQALNDLTEISMPRLARRIVTLEAQVLASETVSKAEYAAMVEQRNTLREELKAARLRIEQLQDTGKLAELEARAELAREVADNCSGDYMRAILDGEIDRAEHESRHL